MKRAKRGLALTLALTAGLLVAVPVFAADWKQDGRGWQYQYADGNVHTGWLQLQSKWYYFDSSGHMVENTFQTINNKKYLFDSNGVMQTGWSKAPDGNWYYFNMNGEMQTGWHLINGWWYYMDTNTGKMLTGWNNINGTWYFMYDSGNMAHDTWIDNKYYVFSDGHMATGPQNIKGQNYLFTSTGEWIPDGDKNQSQSTTTVAEELLYNEALPDLDWDGVKKLAQKYYSNFYETSNSAIEKLNGIRAPEHLANLKFSQKLTKSAFALCIASKSWDFWGVDDTNTSTKEYEAALDQFDARNLALNVTMTKGATLNDALNEALLTKTGKTMLTETKAETCGVGFIKVNNEYRVVIFTGRTPSE